MGNMKSRFWNREVAVKQVCGFAFTRQNSVMYPFSIPFLLTLVLHDMWVHSIYLYLLHNKEVSINVLNKFRNYYIFKKKGGAPTLIKWVQETHISLIVYRSSVQKFCLKRSSLQQVLPITWVIWFFFSTRVFLNLETWYHRGTHHCKMAGGFHS